MDPVDHQAPPFDASMVNEWKEFQHSLWLEHPHFRLCFVRLPNKDKRKRLMQCLADQELCRLKDAWRRTGNLDTLVEKLGVTRAQLTHAVNRGQATKFRCLWPSPADQDQLEKLRRSLGASLADQNKLILPDGLRPFEEDSLTAKVNVTHIPFYKAEAPAAPKNSGLSHGTLENSASLESVRSASHANCQALSADDLMVPAYETPETHPHTWGFAANPTATEPPSTTLNPHDSFNFGHLQTAQFPILPTQRLHDLGTGVDLLDNMAVGEDERLQLDCFSQL